MGVLTVGEPLSWEESKQFHEYIKRHGVLQFINCWKQHKDDIRTDFRWGDEVEYNIVRMIAEKRVSRLSCRAPELLPLLEASSCKGTASGAKQGVDWKPEYANWMIEGTPGQPYNDSTSDLIVVETNLRLRRRCASEHLYDDELIMMMPAFPRMGCGLFTSPPYLPSPHGSISQSLYIPDEVIQPHPRFPTLTANIRKRRGEKVAIFVPLFKDKNTDFALRLPSPPEGEEREKKEEEEKGGVAAAVGGGGFPAPDESNNNNNNNDFDDDDNEGENKKKKSSFPLSSDGAEIREEVYMDCMAFGMGCCCLQVTMQTTNLDEARDLYDQLAVLAPLMMCLSAATPILKGFLTENDVRWDVIAKSVDCRNAMERGVERIGPESPAVRRIQRSRYDNIECYISRSPLLLPSYNDISVQVDDLAMMTMLENGIDERLATHIAHLFIRDPLVVFRGKVEEVDDEGDRDHFENLQSTNWNTVRFKPPPAHSDIGWRVEFRSMDLALTEFDNAMHSVFVVLLSRAILSFRLNLYVPMTTVEYNMRRAHKRDAVLNETFFFRKNIFSAGECEAMNMTVDQIFNGFGGASSSSSSHHHDSHHHHSSSSSSETPSSSSSSSNEFPGLIPLVRKYLKAIDCPPEHLEKINSYLNVLSLRAAGKLMTGARYMRHFVLNHPEYKQDSVVSDAICFDLLSHLDLVTRGVVSAPEMLGDVVIPCQPMPKRKPRPAEGGGAGESVDASGGGGAAAAGGGGGCCGCGTDEFQSKGRESPSLQNRRLRGSSLILDAEAVQKLLTQSTPTPTPTPNDSSAVSSPTSSSVQFPSHADMPICLEDQIQGQ